MFNPNKCEHKWRKIPKDLLLYKCTKCGWIVFKSEKDFEVFHWGYENTVKRDRKTGQWYKCGGWHHEPWALAGFDHYTEDSLIPKGSKWAERNEELYRRHWELREEQLNKYLEYFKQHGFDERCDMLWREIDDANLQTMAKKKTGINHVYPDYVGAFVKALARPRG